MRSVRSFAIALLWSGPFLVQPVLAQHPGRSAIGLKAAALISTNHAATLQYDPVPGAAAGVYFPLWCGNRFELQPELLFSWQGAGFSLGERERQVARYYYLQLPLSAKVYLTNSLNLQGGVQGSRLLHAQVNGEDATEDYRKFEVGFNSGLGLDLARGIDLCLRYYSGLTPILVGDDAIFPTNRTVQFSVGYRMSRVGGRTRFSK